MCLKEITHDAVWNCGKVYKLKIFWFRYSIHTHTLACALVHMCAQHYYSIWLSLYHCSALYFWYFCLVFALKHIIIILLSTFPVFASSILVYHLIPNTDYFSLSLVISWSILVKVYILVCFSFSIKPIDFVHSLYCRLFSTSLISALTCFPFFLSVLLKFNMLFYCI